MGLVVKTNPVGVDTVINDMQNRVWDHLASFQSDWDSHPRCYVNPKGQDKSKNTAEFFSNNDYTDVLMSDKVALSTFWLADQNRTYSRTIVTQRVSLIVQCSDLTKLYPEITHRADEELLSAFVDAHESFRIGRQALESIDVGVDEAYSGLDTSDLKFDNMNEFFVFRMNFTVKYDRKC